MGATVQQSFACLAKALEAVNCSDMIDSVVAGAAFLGCGPRPFHAPAKRVATMPHTETMMPSHRGPPTRTRIMLLGTWNAAYVMKKRDDPCGASAGLVSSLFSHSVKPSRCLMRGGRTDAGRGF